MNYDTMQTPIDTSPQVCALLSRALELARDNYAQAGSIKATLFGCDPQTSVGGSAGQTPPQTPACVVDYLRIITGVLEETAQRLNETDHRL